MPEPKATNPQPKRRPRSKTFLTIDGDNAYARLGVSPLASTDEIAARINERRGKAMRQARAKAKRSVGEEEEEVFRLDRIAEEIGTPDARAKYDEQHPQNVLLTVQPSLAEQAWLRYRKAGLISEWLCGELGPAEFVPSLRCLKLWTPNGLDEQLLALLNQFARTGSADAAATEQPAGPSARASLSDLTCLLQEEDDV